jgi:hypothetical protein
MRKILWPGVLLLAGLPVLGHAQETGAGCEANIENATFELHRADEDPAEALNGWLRHCAPSGDLRRRYTLEIEQAFTQLNPARPSSSSLPGQKDPLHSPEPPPQDQKQPIGTFAQHGHQTFDDRSGWFEWDDTLVIHKDGTAEVTTKYKINLYSGWYLTGCSDEKRVGTDLRTEHFTVVFDKTTVSLRHQGPIEVSKADPPCWRDTVDDDPTEPWVLDWIDGHLKDKDGEYYRQE